MPSCSGADFEVIDQYLILKDQIDSEDDTYSVASDQKLPQFSTSFLGGPDQDASSTSSPLNFTAMEGPGEPWMPINFLCTGGGEPLPTATAVPVNPSTATSVQTNRYLYAGSGCTVIEASPPGVGVPFPEDPMSSPDLYDLDCDKHTSFYPDKDGGGGFYEGKPTEIKTERVDEFQSLGGGMLGRHCDNHLQQDSSMLREDKEDLTTFMIQSLRDDILRDCKQLGISHDPEKWSPADSLTWVNSVLRKDSADCPQLGGSAGAESLGLHVLNVPGHVLCRMSLHEFQRCLPTLGRFLHQRLEIWRMAMDITSDPVQSQWYSSSKQHPHHHPSLHHYHHPATSITTTTNNNIVHGGAPMYSDYSRGGGPVHMPPSISPAPSTDSTCSSLSHSSSSSSSLGGGRGGGGGAGVPHPSVGYSLSQDRLEDEVFGYGGAAAAVTARPRKTIHPPATHQGTSPSHLPTPTRGPRAGKQTIHLWQFLRELLDNADSYHDCIKWTDRSRGIFKIEDSSKVARLWGRRKNRPAMNYDKLSRSVRQYYKKGIIRKTEHSKRLVYQFCQPYL